MPTKAWEAWEIANELRCTVTLKRCQDYGCRDPGVLHNDVQADGYWCPACLAWAYLVQVAQDIREGRAIAPAPANAVPGASQREAGHHDGWHANRARMQWERYRAGELVETQSFITADTWRAWPYASSQEEP